MGKKDMLVLHPKHGVAPSLTFCYICGKEGQEIALLGAKADVVMKQLYVQSKGAHGSAQGYREYGFNRVPSVTPCDACKAYLDRGGLIIIARDKEEYLRLDAQQVDELVGRVADAKGHVIDFEAMRGKVTYIKKAFWFQEGDNIRLRDPKEWTED